MGEGTQTHLEIRGTLEKAIPLYNECRRHSSSGMDLKSFLRAEDEGGKYKNEGEIKGNDATSPPNPSPSEWTLSRFTRHSPVR